MTTGRPSSHRVLTGTRDRGGRPIWIATTSRSSIACEVIPRDEIPDHLWNRPLIPRDRLGFDNGDISNRFVGENGNVSDLSRPDESVLLSGDPLNLLLRVESVHVLSKKRVLRCDLCELIVCPIDGVLTFEEVPHRQHARRNKTKRNE